MHQLTTDAARPACYVKPCCTTSTDGAAYSESCLSQMMLSLSLNSAGPAGVDPPAAAAEAEAPAKPEQKGKPKPEPYEVPRGGRFWLHDDRAGGNAP